MGTSRKYEDCWGKSYVEHKDDRGNIIGTSRQYEDCWGKPYLEHRDNNGNVIGTSRQYEDLWGKPYAEHKSNCRGTMNPSTGITVPVGGGSSGGSLAFLPATAVVCVILGTLYEIFQDFFIRHELAFRLSAEFGYPLLLLMIIALAVRKQGPGTGLKMGLTAAILTAMLMYLTLEVLRPVSDAYFHKWENNPDGYLEWVALGSGFLLFYVVFLTFPLTAVIYRKIIRRAATNIQTELTELGGIHLILIGIATSVVFFVIYFALEFEGEDFFSALLPCLFLIVHTALASMIMLALSSWILTHE